jgi:hypothetical protein
MEDVYIGKTGNYHWVSFAKRYLVLPEIVTIPSFVKGKYAVLTTFDGGPPFVYDQTEKMGWTKEGKIVWTSKIKDATDICKEGFEEMYVFDNKIPLPEIKVFVNYLYFALFDPEIVLRANPTWDRRLFDGQLKLQELFWEQMDKIKPISFASDGDHFNLATQDERFFANLLAKFRNPFLQVDKWNIIPDT